MVWPLCAAGLAALALTPAAHAVPTGPKAAVSFNRVCTHYAQTSSIEVGCASMRTLLTPSHESRPVSVRRQQVSKVTAAMYTSHLRSSRHTSSTCSSCFSRPGITPLRPLWPCGCKAGRVRPRQIRYDSLDQPWWPLYMWGFPKGLAALQVLRGACNTR